jgi:hypothetical protein
LGVGLIVVRDFETDDLNIIGVDLETLHDHQRAGVRLVSDRLTRAARNRNIHAFIIGPG